MSLYGRTGQEDYGTSDDVFFIEERTEQKQGGFQPMLDFKNKFSFVPAMEHFKASPKLMSIGSNVSYGITENGELMAWTTENDKNTSDKNFNIDLKSATVDSKDGGVMGRAGTQSFNSQPAQLRQRQERL